MTTTATPTTTRRLGAGALGLTGLLHLVLAPEYLGQQAYVGVLFILGGIAACALAVRLWRADDNLAWAGAAALAAGMAAGFVLSRTVGLPGFHESEWEISGLLSVVLEAGVVGAALRATRPAAVTA